MTHLQRQVQTAQRRLWMNRFGVDAARFLTAGGITFGLVVLLQRLFAWPIPLGWVAIGFGSAVLLAAGVWTYVHRESAALAAARLDEAAGLRERLSSGRYCVDVDDPFAQAVVADAERVSSSVSARQHIRLHAPRPWPWTLASFIVASSMFLLSPGLLVQSEAEGGETNTEDIEQARVAVKRQVDALRKAVQENPVFDDIKDELSDLDKMAGGTLSKAKDVRHTAIKKIDRLSDALKKKKSGDRYDATRAMRKMLRGLKPPPAESQTQKLANALNKGDFKAAQKEVEALKEMMATLKSKEDQETVAQMSKQLDELAKQLEKLAANKKLMEQLSKTGLTKEQLEKMLANLKKEDIDRIKKMLEKAGMDPKQIEKLAKQMKQQGQSGEMAKRLAKALKQASQGGASGGSAEGLSMAGAQLGALADLDAELVQMESMMAALDQAKNDLDKPCSNCKGTGMAGSSRCSSCQGSGGTKPGSGGMGKMGQGRGGLAPEQQTNVGFKMERGKVAIGRGAIIGQFRFSGEQIKGEVDSSFTEVFSAAQREASDLVNRDRIPRQYQKAVKDYFSTVQESLERARTGANSTPQDGSSSPTKAESPSSND